MSALRFEGSSHFRQRIALAVLSGRAVRIENIRALDDDPGLRDYEVNFLQLVEKVTNGTVVEIGYTGTAVLVRPGIVSGARNVVHDCGTARSIGYFLEGIIALLPFGKAPSRITFTGITNDDRDPSVDTLRTVTLPLLRKFGIDEGLELKITKRGAPPLGGGEVVFQCPIVRKLIPMQLLDPGKIKRIRGIAYSTRVAPQTANRIVDASRALLNAFIPDVYIYTDHYRGQESGLSPGFALSLVAESTTGTLLCAESAAVAGQLPEEVGERTAQLLFEEIKRGGCIDTQNQSLAMLLMALGPEDVSRVRLGMLSPHTVQFLRDMRDFFGTTFKIETDAQTHSLLVSCIGIGYLNVSKKVA